MTTTVKATYTNGVFTPQEPVDLEEGTEVTVSVGSAPRESAEAAGGDGASLLGLSDSEVRVTADVQFSGRLAELGQPLIRRKADAMVRDSARNMQAAMADR